MKRLIIRLHGGLERYAPAGQTTELAVDGDVTLVGVQSMLRIPPGEVGIFVVDGDLTSGDDLAHDVAVVDMYPMFGGG